MPDGISLLLWIGALVTLIGVPLYAARVRSRRYGSFGLIVLGLSVPGALIAHARLRELLPADLQLAFDLLFLYSLAAAAAHMTSLVRARLRHAVFRVALSIPGQVFLAGGFLSGVWLLALLPIRVLLYAIGAESAAEILRWADALPLVVAVASVITSTRPVHEVVRIELGRDGPGQVERVPVARYRYRSPPALTQRPIRMVQIADPHLGPWQPVEKLQRHIAVLTKHEPDLVLLTGDFLTMEGSGTPGGLGRALEPLRELPGRCYAVFGNHDHDPGAREEVEKALTANGIRLLVDEMVCADTPAGPVQIVGADYVRRAQHREHLHDLLARHPRIDGHLRLLMLHDPSAFAAVPIGEADLTLSGHTHGGQVGLVSLGLDWTVLARSAWPDHGLFGHGSNRLYVHRGTGFYGFPLRIGVPGESSLIEVIRP